MTEVIVTVGGKDRKYHTNPLCTHMGEKTKRVDLNTIPWHEECSFCSGEVVNLPGVGFVESPREMEKEYPYRFRCPYCNDRPALHKNRSPQCKNCGTLRMLRDLKDERVVYV